MKETAQKALRQYATALASDRDIASEKLADAERLEAEANERRREAFDRVAEIDGELHEINGTLAEAEQASLVGDGHQRASA